MYIHVYDWFGVISPNYMGVSKNNGIPKSSILDQFSRVFHCKPSILEYPYFWKHPYIGAVLGPSLPFRAVKRKDPFWTHSIFASGGSKPRSKAQRTQRVW